MRCRTFIVATLAAAQATAAPSTFNPREQPKPCNGNTANNRSVWCNYDISTNHYDVVPDTGVTREYFFDIQNSTLAPDGVERVVLTVNGQLPGPTIYADWGDTIVVHVSNHLALNGTSIHFHGVQQKLTNPMDGVPSITQCPQAPGDTFTYTWRATQYGSTWYHSHYSLQAWEAVFGGIIINGPATANYDQDLGSLFLNDWTHETASALYYTAETTPTTFVLDTGLINGTNVYQSGGSRWHTNFTPGQTYRLRVVNAAIDSHFDFMIDNHELQVIAADFVPIHPYTTKVVSIGIGQRYDILVTANKNTTTSNFWLRAIPDSACSNNANPTNIKGIIHYNRSTGEPTTSPWPYSPTNCTGEAAANLLPYLSLDAVSSGTVNEDLVVTAAKTADQVFKWYIKNSTFNVQWSEPPALQILNVNTTWSTSQNVIEIPKPNSWTVIVIETDLPVPHPIHLHGHDFWQLAQGTGKYADVRPVLETRNPPRRDVSMLPGSGFMVIAFVADNPGAWLCHCHIGWHTEMGFALQFIEREDEIAGLYDRNQLEHTCDAWDAWDARPHVVDNDGSGV